MQGIQGISLQASEEFGLTRSFAAKPAKQSGKKQGIPGLTRAAERDESGIALIQFPQTFFRKLFSRCRSSREMRLFPQPFSRPALSEEPRFLRENRFAV